MNSNLKLTPREEETKELLLKGYTNKEIANKLIVSEHTAKAHVSSILHKLGAKNRFDIFVQEIEKHKSINQSCEKGVSYDNK